MLVTHKASDLKPQTRAALEVEYGRPLKDIPVDEFEEIFLEAMRSVRPGYEEVR